jgi:large conductance mechanosensitive channel
MPPVGLALGGIDFSQLKIVLQESADPAKEVAIRWGTFVNVVIAFIVVAFVVFMISRVFIREPAPAPVKTCSFCKTDNAIDATRCKACTSQI